MDNISLGLLVAYLTASYSVLATGDNCLGNDTYIFIGNDTKIEKSVLTGDTKSSWKTLIKANSRPLGFDVDITTCTFFYSTGSKRHKGKIFAVNLINGSAGKIHRNLGYPLQVAVNWITQKLYWCDSTLSTIEYSDFDGDNRETLLENISIEAIALDPCANDIYWISKEDEDNYVISKMKLDGTNRHVIVSSNLEAPNSLVIDFISSKLYWTDKFKIQTSDLEGADRSTIYTTKVRRPTGISFYDNILYWAEWKNKIVSTCTTNGTDVRILVDNVNRSAAIHVMDRSRCLNGGWGSWTSWSSCSVTCGDSQKTRRRFCDNPPPSGGGSNCSGNSSQQQTCDTKDCPVNGGWGSWSSWSSCSATYGDSQKTRQRFCDNPPPSGGGSNCIGSSSQQKNCNITVNGQWGPFGSWSTCSQTCGGGIHTRQRSCDSPPPSNGGADCVGNATHQRNCDVNVCPVVNGGWSSWTNWSSCVEVCTALPSCSKICSHQRVRERFCNNPTPSGGGKNCSGNYSQQQACDAANSPEKPQFKDDFFRPSGGHHSYQVQAICHFDSNGVAGNVHLLQRRINSGKTRVNMMLDGLDGLPGSDEYGLCVTEYPADLNTANPCAPAIVGGVYNPEGIDMSVSDYPDRCQADHGDCAIGDLATRHSPLTGNDTNTLVGLKDFNLNLFGPNTVVGRGMSLKRLDTDETLACCNIEMPTNTRVLRAPFNNGVFSGVITITQPRYDYLDYTKNENAIITVDLERIDGGVANIPMLQWNLRRGIADSTCSNLEPQFGHQIATVGDPSETCSQTQHRTCRLGDLTNKCGPLQLVNNRIRTQCTDNQLGLVSFSTLDRLAVSIDQGLTILDCAQLNEVMPAGAYVNFNFDRPRVTVNLAFSQLTPQDPTMYRTFVTGLDGQAGNIVVFDGEDCDNLGNVLNYPGELPTSLPMTGDQYPVGELGPKMGGVLGRDYLRNQGLSSNIPLTGPVNITGKPITVLFQNGSVWGCGMVENYYNMPYTPPEDVIDYLDLFVTPAP